ncbi:MAG: hypothetical protein KGL39_47975 [Patescibacteria group bacterium]|nr:hypothetical protein [Patescibacteria group bacterium]
MWTKSQLAAIAAKHPVVTSHGLQWVWQDDDWVLLDRPVVVQPRALPTFVERVIVPQSERTHAFHWRAQNHNGIKA